jgi:alkanesulfonate monooxygenase SsuD/methylene tetrahydromethanopterin reductase-like flavin-dependent oxidoreductase (luciferase family)
VGDVFARVRTACDQVGRDPSSLQYSVMLHVCCAAPSQEIRRRLEAAGQAPAQFAGRGVAGRPAEVAGRLAAYADVGATRGYLTLADLPGLDQLELLASEVLPRI